MRDIIAQQAPRYKEAKTKEGKGSIIVGIVKSMISSSPTNSGFVRQDKETGRWYFIGMEKAKDKIGHALRKASQKLGKSNQQTTKTPSRTTVQTADNQFYGRDPHHDILPIVSNDSSSTCTPNGEAEPLPIDIHNPTVGELQARHEEHFYHQQQQHSHQHPPFYYPPNSYSYYPQYPHYPPPPNYHYEHQPNHATAYPPPAPHVGTPHKEEEQKQPSSDIVSYEAVWFFFHWQQLLDLWNQGLELLISYAVAATE